MHLQRFDPSKLDLIEQRLNREKSRRREIQELQGSLIKFFEAAWPEFDPAPYVHGWHLEAIAEHLEAVTRGEIKKLLINIPPRHSKSLLCSVAWPAWIWAQQPDPEFPLMGPQVKFMCLSFSESLSLDHALLMRRLVQTDWYQQRWGKTVKIASDQAAVSKFDTTKNGTRLSSSFSGTITGRGGDIKIIDDPHKADEALSEATREAVIRKYDNVLKSRMTDPKTTAEVIIMQRLHQQDLSGHVIEKDPSFVHLKLPASFDKIYPKCYTVLGWEDPRNDQDELLWPQRFGDTELETFRRSPSWESQWQQNPFPAGGGIIKRKYWGLYEPRKTADGKLNTPPLHYRVASLDTAFTAKEQNDPSALTIWGVYMDRNGNPKILLLNAWRKWLELHGPTIEREDGESTEQYVRRCKPQWGLVETVSHDCKRFDVQTLLIENKAAGHSVNQAIRNLHQGKGDSFVTKLVDPKRLDKVARAWSVAHIFAEGIVEAPDLPWAEIVIDECEYFPNSTHDDLVDTVSQALSHLREIGYAIRREERHQQEMEDAMHYSIPGALYDV